MLKVNKYVQKLKVPKLKVKKKLENPKFINKLKKNRTIREDWGLSGRLPPPSTVSKNF